MREVRLSIVIPTKNRADKLQIALESIVIQKSDQDLYEVIVIDNGSTDHTKDCVAEYYGRIKNLRYIYDARPGLHVGRNRGIRESKGSIIGLLDDDVVLFPNWIGTVLEAFEDEATVAVCGSVVPYDMSLITSDFKKKYTTKSGRFRYAYPISCFWQERITEEDTYVQPANRGMLIGCNSVYRKSVLLKCDGFHPDGMPNHLLMYRGDGETYVTGYMFDNGMKVMYYAQASVYHQIDASRVDDAYLAYMFFRSGISHMYTQLRKDGLYGGVMHMLKNMRWSEFKKTGSFHRNRGGAYLLLYYLFYKRIRKWVHRKNYF